MYPADQPDLGGSIRQSSDSQTRIKPSVDSVQQIEQDQAQQIIGQYLDATRKIPEVKKVRYRLHKKGIEFIVMVERIRRKLSGQLANIELQLSDDYPEWSISVECLSFPTYVNRTRNQPPGLSDQK